MNTRLDLLIEQYFAQSLTTTELAELNAALESNPAAMDYFVDQLDLHVGLAENMRSELPTAVAAELATAAGKSRGTRKAQRKKSSDAKLRLVGRRRHGSRLPLVMGGLAMAAAAVLAVLYVRGDFTRMPSKPLAMPDDNVPSVAVVDETARTATVEWMYGEVRQSREATTGAAQTVTIGDTLRAGTLLICDNDSEVLLRYPDGSALKARGGTLQLTTAGQGKSLRLERGSAMAEVQPQAPGAPMILSTPLGQATVVGTVFQLTSHPGESALYVRRGAVEFSRLTDGVKQTVRGDGAGQVAVIAPDQAFEILTPVAPEELPVTARVPARICLNDPFSRSVVSAENWTFLNPDRQAGAAVEAGEMRLRLRNAEPAWKDWYAATKSSFAVGPLRLTARLKLPRLDSNLVAGVSLLDGGDSGRGERENIELLFRGDGVALRRAAYPANGSKNGPHPETELGAIKTGDWQAEQWIQVTIDLDATRVQAQVNGRELYSGMHGMQDWQRLRLAIYAGLKQTDGELTVAVDDVRLERQTAKSGPAGEAGIQNDLVQER